MWSIWYPWEEAFGGWPRNSLISARLLIFAQLFLSHLLIRLGWHAAMPPEMKTECANTTLDRHHSSKKKPNRHRHVFSRFSIFCAVAKWTCQRLPNRRKDRQEEDRQDFRLHVMMRSRFILR